MNSEILPGTSCSIIAVSALSGVNLFEATELKDKLRRKGT